MTQQVALDTNVLITKISFCFLLQWQLQGNAREANGYTQNNLGDEHKVNGQYCDGSASVVVFHVSKLCSGLGLEAS